MRWIDYIESLGFARECYSGACLNKDCNSCQSQQYSDSFMLIYGQWIIKTNYEEQSIEITDLYTEEVVDISEFSEYLPEDKAVINIYKGIKKYYK